MSQESKGKIKKGEYLYLGRFESQLHVIIENSLPGFGPYQKLEVRSLPLYRNIQSSVLSFFSVVLFCNGTDLKEFDNGL